MRDGGRGRERGREGRREGGREEWRDGGRGIINRWSTGTGAPPLTLLSSQTLIFSTHVRGKCPMNWIYLAKGTCWIERNGIRL